VRSTTADLEAAYHEAGHARVALALGGTIRCLSLDPCCGWDGAHCAVHFGGEDTLAKQAYLAFLYGGPVASAQRGGLSRFLAPTAPPARPAPFVGPVEALAADGWPIGADSDIDRALDLEPDAQRRVAAQLQAITLLTSPTAWQAVRRLARRLARVRRIT
jgi:hypothetical protein